MNRTLHTLAIFLSVAVMACGTSGSSGDGGAGGANGDTAFPPEGPQSIVREDSDDFVYFFPQDLDTGSTWPALVWFNGSSGYAEDFNYNGLLESIASWGFVVIGGKSAGMNGPDADQRTELLRRNADPDDSLFGQVDESLIAVAGHSLGGFQTTDASAQYRVAIAVQGAGTPTTSEDRADPLHDLRRRRGRRCLSRHDSIRARRRRRLARDACNCGPQRPANRWGRHLREPIVAFLRWQLSGDANGEQWFEGDACVLCTAPAWGFDAQ